MNWLTLLTDMKMRGRKWIEGTGVEKTSSELAMERYHPKGVGFKAALKIHRGAILCSITPGKKQCGMVG